MKNLQKITDGILPPPNYFFEDARINKEGYTPIDDVIRDNTKPLTADEFMKATADGAIILDARSADDFEKGFIPGSLNIGLNGQFAVWVGTLVDISKRLVLVTQPGKESETVLRLARVGYENIVGYLDGSVNAYRGPLQHIDSINLKKSPVRFATVPGWLTSVSMVSGARVMRKMHYSSHSLNFHPTFKRSTSPEPISSTAAAVIAR